MVIMKELADIGCCISVLMIERKDLIGDIENIGDRLAKATRGCRFIKVFIPKDTIDEKFIVKYIRNACIGSDIVAKIYYYE